MSICPSVRLHGTTLLSLDGFLWNLIFQYFFLKSAEKFQFSFKLDTNNGCFIWRPIKFLISRSVLLRMRNVSDKFVEQIKTHISCQTTFFRKLCRLWDNVKRCRAGQATGDNMTHAHCILDTKGYKHTIRICNIYCLPTTTNVARTRPIVTL